MRVDRARRRRTAAAALVEVAPRGFGKQGVEQHARQQHVGGRALGAQAVAQHGQEHLARRRVPAACSGPPGTAGATSGGSGAGSGRSAPAVRPRCNRCAAASPSSARVVEKRASASLSARVQAAWRAAGRASMCSGAGRRGGDEVHAGPLRGADSASAAAGAAGPASGRRRRGASARSVSRVGAQQDVLAVVEQRCRARCTRARAAAQRARGFEQRDLGSRAPPARRAAAQPAQPPPTTATRSAAAA